MTENNHRGRPLTTLLRKALTTGVRAFQNRGELFLVELQEEKSRMISLAVLGMSAVFLGMATGLLLTGIVIFLFPPEQRLYVAGGFALLYLIATVWAVFRLKAVLRQTPFGETAAQFRKDHEIMEAFR